MNMYRDSYVVALLVGGKIQKESKEGEVLLPFGSEYVIRLKNKLRKRSVADVWIDGKVAAKGIVVDANGTVDLERFVEDGNLTEGKRFKLVRVNDPKVEQPDDSENGTIEVNFYPEKDEPVVEKTVIYDYKHYCNHNYHGHCYQCCNSMWCNFCHPKYTFGATWDSSASKGLQGGNLNLGVNLDSGSVSSAGMASAGSPVSMNNVVYNASNSTGELKSVNASTDLGEAAATVGGSTSLQKFSSVYIDVDRSKPVTIRLTVKGVSKVVDTCSCGFKRKKEKYCPNDGTQLVA